MKTLSILSVFLFGVSALAGTFASTSAGYVTAISVADDSSVEFQTSNGTKYQIEPCSGLFVTDGDLSRKYCNRNEMIVMSLHQSLAARTPISVLTKKNNIVTAVSIDAAK